MLDGLRVLIAEDEPMVADDLCEIIREAEGVVVGLFATVNEARALIAGGAAIDAAILDVNLGDGTVTPVLEGLHARGIPFLVYTGASVPEDVQGRHPDLVSLTKPVPRARLIAELRRVSGKLVA